MADEIVKVISIQTDASITTVKDLKKYINELRDSLVTLDKDTEEYEDTVKELTEKQKQLTEVQSAGKNSYTALDDSIKGLRLQLKALNNTYDELSAADRNSDVGKNLLAQIQGIDAQLKELEASTGRHQRNVGNYQSALEALNGTYATQRQELKALKGALDNLEPGTEAYNQAFNRAAELTHNLALQQEMLKYSSQDLGDQISNIRGIATGMIAGFSAANAAMGLFGTKNEDVAKAMLKVQQAMAIVQGLQGMDGLLKRTQGLSNAMKVWFKSTKEVTTATNAQTVAQKGLNAALKANPIGFVITLVMALAVAIKPLISLIEKLTGKFNEMNNSASASTAAMREFDETISNLDEQNRLEEILMQASGLSQIVVIEKKIEGQQDKLNKTTEEYLRQLGYVNQNIKQYSKDGAITTGTLEKLGYTQDQINDLMKTGEINIKESNKALSNFTKNEGFKTMLDNVLRLSTNIKDVKTNIKGLQNDAKAANVKSAVDAAKEAVKKREQIEQDYQNTVKAIHSQTVGSIIDDYKKELNTLLAYTDAKLKDEKDFILKQGYKSNKGTIEGLLSKLVGLDEVAEKQDLNLISGYLKKMEDLIQPKIKNSIEFAATEVDKKINDEIIKLFEKTLQPDLTTELARLQRVLDDTSLRLSFETETGYDFETWLGSGLFKKLDGFNKKQSELASVARLSTIRLEALTTELKHYQEIVDYVDENELVPSDEYNKALAKIEEINTKINEESVNRWQQELAINKKYFDIEIQQAEDETQRLLDNVDEFYTNWSSNRLNKSTAGNIFSEMLGFNNSNFIEDSKNKMEATYQVQKSGLEKIKSLWEQRSNDEKLNLAEREEAQRNYNETVRQLALLEVEYDKQKFEQKKQLTQDWVNYTKSAISAIGDLFGALADIYKDEIDAEKDKNKLSNEEAEKQYKKKVQPLMVAQATINMLQGMVAAFASAMSLGPIAGPIAGTALATLVGAVGMANIAKIKSTNPYSSNGGSSSIGAASAPTQDYDFSPTYVQNATSESDIDNLRNALSEQPIRAFVLEADITNSQNLANKRNAESSF